MAEIWPYPPSDTAGVISGPDKRFPGRLLGIKAARVPSRMCSALTDLQLASSTPALVSSLIRVSHQPVSPAHRLPAYIDSCLSPSLCVVRADYKLARQFTPELYNTGTELEQQRSMPYRSQISH
jgi:hypothetical protein